MRFLFYTQSLVSDWNHGNAHFLRGVMRELQRAGHEALALEPADSWSRRNLVAEQGAGAIAHFCARFPDLRWKIYDSDFDHDDALARADVVVVHEWTDPSLVARIGRTRREASFLLLFHDTHHRAVSASDELARLDLDDYDGVLAFGEALRQRYLRAGWGSQVFTWHEAADTSTFRPHPDIEKIEDLVWIGNWGDGERARELSEYLCEPARNLSLTGGVHGVRYPEEALALLSASNLAYRGWIPNCEVPRAFAAARATVHIPRRPYVEQLPGIPTIRVFEALACGIPLICAPWRDEEGLFHEERDFLMAHNREEMTRLLHDVLHDQFLSEALARHGLDTVRNRHSCAHRVQELLGIVGRLGSGVATRTRDAAA
ncbi:MAG: glycosyltransferase [Rhizobiaceae bacterium]|nr:glycosyltransferase [Rhizobiaceae bacterium]MCV0407473.1 glycosyltransferase [Rhizobiaceae bacterium]